MEKRGQTYSIGEIYWVKLDGKGSVQTGWHPGVIVQNDVGNKYSNTIIIVPITSRKKTNLPTHVKIKSGKFGLIKESTVQCEGQRPVDKSQIGEYIGEVDNTTMSEIAKACLISTPYLFFLSEADMKGIYNCQNKLFA